MATKYFGTFVGQGLKRNLGMVARTRCPRLVLPSAEFDLVAIYYIYLISVVHVLESPHISGDNYIVAYMKPTLINSIDNNKSLTLLSTG